MRRIDIRDKLNEIEMPVEALNLGEFDQIGELTAKKARNPSDPLFKSKGCYFRPNYERGLLIYSLIKRFEVKTFLEIGFGRGYGALCAAKAMSDMGLDDARVYTVDPRVDENHLKMLAQAFPKEWFGRLNLLKGTVNDAMLLVKDDIDMVYIDGDHTFDAVKHDWDMVKDRFAKFVLFDDYDEANNPAIQVKQLIDEIDMDKELIISDRRIFGDDRNIADADINYGQVLIKNPGFDADKFLSGW